MTTSAVTTTRRLTRETVVAVPPAGDENEEDSHQARPAEDAGLLIPYPCCPKEKAVVFPGAHGFASYKCPNCGKYAMFDFDSLTSKPGRVCRGAGKRSRAVNR